MMFGIKLFAMEKLDFMDTEKISQLFQEAVIKAIETHHQKGESIAIGDGEGGVKIIPAQEIPELIKSLNLREVAKK